MLCLVSFIVLWLTVQIITSWEHHCFLTCKYLRPWCQPPHVHPNRTVSQALGNTDTADDVLLSQLFFLSRCILSLNNRKLQYERFGGNFQDRLLVQCWAHMWLYTYHIDESFRKLHLVRYYSIMWYGYQDNLVKAGFEL